MPVVPDIAFRAKANAATFKPTRDAIAGEPGYEVRVFHNHATEHAAWFKNNGAGPVLLVENALGDDMIEVTQTGVSLKNATFTGQQLAAGGTKRLPSMTFAGDPDNGWYPFTTGGITNVMDIGSPAPAAGDTEQYVLVGTGNASGNAIISISKDGVASPGPYPTAMTGLLVNQGSAGLPIAPVSDGGAIRAAAVISSLSGNTYVGIKSTITTERGTGGFVIGGQFSAVAEVNAGSSGAGLTSGVIGAKVTASSTVGGTTGQVLTGLQVNCDALTNQSDTLHVAELDAGTDVSAPAARVILTLSTKAQSQSRRAGTTTLDSFMSWSRKPFGATAGTDDFTKVAPFKYGIVLWNGYDPTAETVGAGTWPFDSGSTILMAPTGVAAGRANDLSHFADMRNVTFADEQYISDSFAISAGGFVGIGNAPTSPLDIFNDSVADFIKFRGSSALTAGGATPGTVAKYAACTYWNGASYSAGKLAIF